MSYNRKALKVDLGKYYKPNPYKNDIITDPAGQWKYPGQVTRIPGNQITMQGVPYPVYGQDDTGFAQMMYPGEEYIFPGNYVDEIPMAQQGFIVSPNRSLAYNNQRLKSGITTLPEIPIHPPQTDQDSNLENVLEIIDPTGISSWDDVIRAYKDTGVSWETALEVLGAVPFLGKIGKSGKVITGGFGLLQDAVKASKYLPKKQQKAFIDAAYKGYQKYADIGGKNVDEILGKTTELIKNNVPYLNPNKWKSSNNIINIANKAFKAGKATDAYQAYDQWDTTNSKNYEPFEYPEGFAVGGIPELPLTAGRKAYHAWGYTNNDFIANRQDGGYIEAELTPEEIEEYRKGGYVVEELPKAQTGKANYADSMSLYNNALQQKAFYDKLKPYYQTPIVQDNSYYKNQGFPYIKQLEQEHLTYKSANTPTDKKKLEQVKNKIKSNKDPNKAYLLDMITGALDLNAPMLEYNANIKPQGYITYTPKTSANFYAKFPYNMIAVVKKYDPNNMAGYYLEKIRSGNADDWYKKEYKTKYKDPITKALKANGYSQENIDELFYTKLLDAQSMTAVPGAVTQLPYYDPIAVKPAALLTDAEVKKRVAKYGTSGIPESRLKKLNISNTKSDTKPIVNKKTNKVITKTTTLPGKAVEDKVKPLTTKPTVDKNAIVQNTKKQLPNKPVEKVDQSRLKPGVYKAQWKQNPVTGTWYQDEAIDLKGDSTVYNPATGGYSKRKYAEGGETLCPDGYYYDETTGECLKINYLAPKGIPDAKGNIKYKNTLIKGYTYPKNTNAAQAWTVEKNQFPYAAEDVDSWYNRWYAGRMKKPEFAKLAEQRLNAAVDKKTPYILEALPTYRKQGHTGLLATTYVKKVGDPANKPYENKIIVNNALAPDMGANDYYNALFVNPEHAKNYFIRELTHEKSHWDDNNYPQVGTDRLDVKKDKVLNSILPKEYLVPGKGSMYDYDTGKHNLNFNENLSKDELDYLKTPTEVRARLKVWRHLNNISPTRDYHPSEIKAIINKNIKDLKNNPDKEAEYNNIMELYHLIHADPKILKELNDRYVKNDSKGVDDTTLQYGKEGGYIELDLTPEEIQQYKDGGYIVEDISVPTLTKAQEGLEQEVYRNQEVPEVPIVAQAPDWLKFSREYESIKPKQLFIEEKKRKYLKQNKGLNKLAGLSMDNFPKEVENNFANEYEYKKNTYVTRKLGKKEGFNPRHRGDWVDELTPGEEKVVANSKYGSKLQPGAYARTLAGLQELANFGIKQLPGTQGDVLKYKIPGLTKREQKEIAESPTGALESFAGLDAPTGYNVINFLKNRGLSTGSNYKELPGLASGELMPNATADEAMAFNPFTYYGLESIPVAVGKGLGKTGKAAIKAGLKAKNVIGNPILRNLKKSAGKYFKPTMHELTNLPTPEELARMNNIERALTIRTYNNSINNPPRLEDFSSVDRFMQQQDIYNQQLKTVQAYIKNSGLSDDDIERIFGRTKEDLLTAKPATATADQLSLTIQPSSIDLRRANRVNQLRNQFTQFTSPPTYNFIDQDAINNIASQARSLPNSPMFTSDILNNLPERLSTEQYNDLHNYYNGMLDAHNIDPYALSGSDYDLMHDIYDKLITNQPKNSKLKNTLNQLKVDIATPVNLSDVQAAYDNKRVLQGAKQSDNVKRVVPSFYARDFESPREALEFVQNKLDEGIKNSNVGDIITGSTNTSHDSYRVQMDYIFKNAGKEGLSEPIFLGYERMNDSGFLTEAGLGHDQIIKKINSDLNKLQKRTGKSVNLKSHPPMLDQNEFGETFIMLPQYGVKKLSQDINKLKKKEEGGPIELELTPEEIQAYRDQGYTVEELD